MRIKKLNKFFEILFNFAFQFTNHKTLDPPINEYILESLYPNSLYHVWVAAKSKRGEGATTPALSTRTEQYCKFLFSKIIRVCLKFEF